MLHYQPRETKESVYQLAFSARRVSSKLCCDLYVTVSDSFNPVALTCTKCVDLSDNCGITILWSMPWVYLRQINSVDPAAPTDVTSKTHSATLFLNSLQWRHNEHDGVSSHRPHDCFLKDLFRRRSDAASKLGVTGLSAGNSPLTGEFPAKRATQRTHNAIMTQR